MLKWKHVEKKVYPPRVAATETRTCSVSQNELFLGACAEKPSARRVLLEIGNQNTHQGVGDY
jgi:hypothetical protein